MSIDRDYLCKDRTKQILYPRIDGVICMDLRPIEAYWSPYCDVALVFIPGEQYSFAEWSRKQMYELGWY